MPVSEQTSPDRLAEGEAHFAAGRMDEAERAFLSALDTEPATPRAYNNLGVIAFSRRQFDHAEHCFRSALKLDPEYSSAESNLDSVLKTRSEIAEKETQPPPRYLTGARLAIINSFDNKFLDLYRDYFAPANDVRVVKPSTMQEVTEIAAWADLVWTTWANESLVAFSRSSGKAALVSHIRSYEILSPELMNQVNWRHVHGGIFVAEHIRNVAGTLWRKCLEGLPQTTIYNSVNLNAYPFTERRPGFTIAYVGYLNHKKGIGLLAQCLAKAVERDHRYRLKIAGSFQETRFEVYMRHLLAEMGLLQHVEFCDWVNDVPAFLATCQYVISTSPWEGCPNNIIEAMACGVKPLVHNWNGARELFGDENVFNTVDQFVDLLTSDNYDSRNYRNQVAREFNTVHQLPKIDVFLAQCLARHRGQSLPELTGEMAATPHMTEAPTWKRYPASAFDPQPHVRTSVLTDVAHSRLADQRRHSVETNLMRAAWLSAFADERVISALTGLYRDEDDIPKLQSLWKRTAVAALERGDLDAFLHHAYVAIYAEHMFGRKPNYRYSIIDQDLRAFIRLAATSHPLTHTVAARRVRLRSLQDGDKLKVGFVLEGLSQRQSSVRAYYPFAEHYDRNRYALHFYSRWPLADPLAIQHEHAITAAQLRERDCAVHTPDRQLQPVEQASFLADRILADQIDVLVFQTTYFVPVHGFLAALKPAPFQAALEHQQSEFCPDLDLVFTTKKQYLESAHPVAPFPIQFTRRDSEPPHARSEHGIPEAATVLISANREMRYSQPRFWNELARVLDRHPNAWFIALGLENLDAHLPQQAACRGRVVTPGYCTDVMRWLGMADLYVDLFPSGAGSSVIEAMAAGLPVLCFEQDWESPFRVGEAAIAHLFVDDHPDLVAKWEDFGQWHTLIDRLIADPTHRATLGASLRSLSARYSPQAVTRTFLESLRKNHQAKALSSAS